MTHLADNCLAPRHPTQNLNGKLILRSWKQLEDAIIPDFDYRKKDCDEETRKSS